MATLSPLPKLYFTGSDGLPLVGGKLYTYAAGTTTPLATYTDSSGGTANANPVILDSRGEASVWLDNSTYKFVLKDDTDALIWTQDNITNGTATSEYASQWLTSVSGTNAVVGSSTYSLAAYAAGLAFRFVPASINTGAVTLNINGLGAKNVLRAGGLALLPGHLQTGSVHTVVYDGTQFTLQNPSINPARVTVASHATTSAIWVASDEINFTGTETITDFPDAPKAGEWRRLICAGACVFTNNANIAVQGAANYTAAAGDIVTIHALTTTSFRVDVQAASQLPVVPNATTSVVGIVELATQTEVDEYTAGKVPTADLLKTNLLRNEQLFTATGTFTQPTGVTKVFVELAGGGGGGGSGNGGNYQAGGYGGFSSGWVTIAANQTVTIGAGGNGADAVNTNGSDGGTTSFGALISATGGGGGQAATAGANGTGSGGLLDLSYTSPTGLGVFAAPGAGGDAGAGGAQGIGSSNILTLGTQPSAKGGGGQGGYCIVRW